MSGWWIMLKRELSSYFATPVGYVCIFTFVLVSAGTTFTIGQFFVQGQADLLAFFQYHPWLYLLIVPAIAMRTWSEERQSGNIELIMTLGVKPMHILLAKFLAAWTLIALCLIFTFPLWLSVNYLGKPDNGLILSAYLGSWLMSGGLLALGMCMSALTKNQLIAFLLTGCMSLICLLCANNSLHLVLAKWVSADALVLLQALSPVYHFEPMSRGIIALNNLVFLLASIGLWLVLGYIAITQRKAV